MKKLTVVILALVIIGVAVNFIPASTYTFGTYIHKEYKDSFSSGISLEYYGIFGTVVKKNYTMYDLGVTVNITKMKTEYYHVDSKLYKVYPSPTGTGFNAKLLPAPPFYGSSVVEISNYSGNFTRSEYSLINMLFPNGNTVSDRILNFTISHSAENMNPSGYLGFPDYYFNEPNFTNIEVSYVHFGSQLAMSAFLTQASNNTINLLTYIFPSFTFNMSAIHVAGLTIMNLGTGNGVPAQDWFGWIYYGFGFAFPLNIILLLSSAILAVYVYRKAN
ncbi:MAG: hypothetical protein LVQ96_06595 [Thermoplasmatales archaeon]|nr:hypothetical protein [Thermoplasmatales archaeon]